MNKSSPRRTFKLQYKCIHYTSAWEQRKLEEIVDVCSGRDYKHLSEGDIPVYGTGGYMTSVSEALSYDVDAIGIGRKGTIDRPYKLIAPFWTVDTLFYAIPCNDVDLNFALCLFLNTDWKSKDESTGLPSLSKQAINESEVVVCSAGEQKRIGSFFSRLDALITLHQRKRQKPFDGVEAGGASVPSAEGRAVKQTPAVFVGEMRATASRQSTAAGRPQLQDAVSEADWGSVTARNAPPTAQHRAQRDTLHQRR
ncbi:restriction endonuclease subunit S [Bifidobacterium sp. SO1]|uniref:restriction endonuclease subunit S n=1 Tax=Bifidobacterium sp. SO1 TaxID=2809029 RepID=UPI001BDCC969|nr:restriction endonuclease subunit S [Bifidobacterium sp. SO1]MBT1160707.1 restriction endonuclease subunit S [Bifidobacterium sp. SO1]